MSRLISALLALIIWAASNAVAAPPNVILIVADDLGWADLGCYGSKFHRTPHLDRLAADGMRFTDAYAACPVCSPSRAALLTGKYPARLNLTDWLPGRPDRPDQKLLRPSINQQLPLEEVTLAEALKTAGYVTGHIGKWHLGGKGFGPEKQGFDVSIAGDETGTPRSYFAPFQDKEGRFMPGLEKADAGEYLPDRLTSEATGFITQNRDRPFFLHLSHYSVHIPLKAKPEYMAKYKSNGNPGEQSNPIYAAMVESLDESIGRICRKLEELKLAETTVLVFTSDNGGLCTSEGPDTPATINAPLREGKGYLYEGGIRVPLLIRAPGITNAGSVNARPVSGIDLLPTVLELCGVKNEIKADGSSLLPMLRGQDASRPDGLYWHYPHYSNQGGRPGGAVRTGDYKLIEFYEQGRHELYNLKSDAGETRNLIEQQPEVTKELHAKLESWRRAIGARMMKPNPDYAPNLQAADGTVMLHARTAAVQGIELRYEPLPHKDTLGFWVRADDWASWEFTLTKPGSFSLSILQGCGKGQGGSEVEFTVGGQTLLSVVEDTGHFQNFKKREIGSVKLDKPGRYDLTVKAKKKPGVAVMDLRAIELRLAATR